MHAVQGSGEGANIVRSGRRLKERLGPAPLDTFHTAAFLRVTPIITTRLCSELRKNQMLEPSCLLRPRTTCDTPKGAPADGWSRHRRVLQPNAHVYQADSREHSTPRGIRCRGRCP